MEVLNTILVSTFFSRIVDSYVSSLPHCKVFTLLPRKPDGVMYDSKTLPNLNTVTKNSCVVDGVIISVLLVGAIKPRFVSTIYSLFKKYTYRLSSNFNSRKMLTSERVFNNRRTSRVNLQLTELIDSNSVASFDMMITSLMNSENPAINVLLLFRQASTRVPALNVSP